MCEIKKVESEKEVSYAEKTCPEEKICQETCEEEIRYIRVPDETEFKQEIGIGSHIRISYDYIIIYAYPHSYLCNIIKRILYGFEHTVLFFNNGFYF